MKMTHVATLLIIALSIVPCHGQNDPLKDLQKVAKDAKAGADRFGQGFNSSTGHLGDKLIEGTIQYATPEADEATRRVQREGAKFMVDPNQQRREGHLEKMMGAVGTMSAGSATAPSSATSPAQASGQGAVPGYVNGAESWSLKRTWGEAGTGLGRFVYVNHSISVDSSGYLYANDVGTGNGQEFRRIQKFDVNGNVVSSWGAYGTGLGQFQGIYQICNDSGGNVYAADYPNRRIQIFKSDGDYLQQVQAGGEEVDGVVVDSHGFIYASSMPRKSVYKLSSSGTVVMNWATVDSPWTLAIDSSDSIYVSSLTTGTIQKFSADGRLLREFSTGANYLHGIAVDRNGNIWAADMARESGGGWVRKFTNDGTAIPVSFDHAFERPIGVVLALDGTLYVSEYQATPHLHAFTQRAGN